MIQYGRQDISQDDIDAVVAVLKSDFLTQGPQVPAFEEAVRNHIGAAHAVAANSATSALHMACAALGLGPGDVLWTSPVTFVASANCARYCGADVDFVDIDPVSYNMSVEKLAEKLAAAKQAGRLPKIVVPVALCGQPCDMAGIRALADEYDFAIVEDASHAIGGKYRGNYVGNGDYADITIFSFHPVKIVTTAEGGLAVTQDATLADAMRLFRSHGITRDAVKLSKPADGPWYYEQLSLGYNYRMTDMQAALGTSQIKRLDEFVARRNELAARYNEILAHLPLQLPRQHPDAYSARHLYVVLLEAELAPRHRAIFEGLQSRGIGTNLHYIPVHLQPYYRNLGFEPGQFPQAEDYYSRAITIPLHAVLTHEQQDQVIAALEAELV